MIRWTADWRETFVAKTKAAAMTDTPQQVVNKAWNFAHVLRDDGVDLIDTENWSSMQSDVIARNRQWL